jgi:hypothetical protein
MAGTWREIHYRGPVGLVAELRERADEQQVSVNALMTALLASGIRWRLDNEEAPAPLPAAGGNDPTEDVSDEQTEH